MTWKLLTYELPPLDPPAQKILVVVNSGPHSTRKPYVDATYPSHIVADFKDSKRLGEWCIFTHWMPMPELPSEGVEPR